jgi:broad specificity phosphatase PhoE
LQTSLPLASQIELIVASPLRRTLQTAQLSLGWLIAQGVPVQLRAEWQETTDKPCDVGTAVATMRDEWPKFDWSTVDPIFPAKEGLYAYSRTALVNRGIECRRWLKARPEKVIAVVTHSAFLRVAICGQGFANADFRIFEFAEGGEEEGRQLVQWESTEREGGGLGKSHKGPLGWRDNDVK